MLKLANNEESEPPLEIYQTKQLSRITFIGLLNSFDYAHNFLAKLKEQGSVDILTLKKDMIKAKNFLFQIYLEIDTILNSYKDGFNIEDNVMKCDFCPETAHTYREYHKWCVDCFNREFGGDLE